MKIRPCPKAEGVKAVCCDSICNSFSRVLRRQVQICGHVRSLGKVHFQTVEHCDLVSPKKLQFSSVENRFRMKARRKGRQVKTKISFAAPDVGELEKHPTVALISFTRQTVNHFMKLIKERSRQRLRNLHWF